MHQRQGSSGRPKLGAQNATAPLVRGARRALGVPRPSWGPCVAARGGAVPRRGAWGPWDRVGCAGQPMAWPLDRGLDGLLGVVRRPK